MKNSLLLTLTALAICAGTTQGYSQRRAVGEPVTNVNVVKSIPLTIEKINSPVAVTETTPVIVDRINTPVKIVEDNAAYKFEYKSEVVATSTLGGGIGPDAQTAVQTSLTNAANNGWKFVSCTPYRPNYTPGPDNTFTITLFLLIYEKKSLR
jgi:hypothetical protein